jgi:hypothetical protein
METRDARGSEGRDPDGSEEQLRILSGDPADYRAYAIDYFETDVPIEVIQRFYAGEPLSQGLLASVAANLGIDEVAPDVDEIGYPEAR